MGEYRYQKKLNWLALASLAAIPFIGPAGLVFTSAIVAGKYMRLGDDKKYAEFCKERDAARKEANKFYLEDLVNSYSPGNFLDKALYSFYKGRVEKQKFRTGLESYLQGMPGKEKVRKAVLTTNESFFGIPYKGRLSYSF